MPTINQLVKQRRLHTRNRTKSPALQGCPQKRGTVTKITVINPKKPNSANRCVCRVRLTNGMLVTAYVPGERNTLAEHANVLIRGGRGKDLPGVRYHIVRGALDCSPADGPTNTSPPGWDKIFRKQRRSVYGVKRLPKK